VLFRSFSGLVAAALVRSRLVTAAGSADGTAGRRAAASA